MPDPVVDGDKSAWANGKRSVDLFEIKMMNSSRYQPLKEGQGRKHFHFGSSHLYFFLSVECITGCSASVTNPGVWFLATKSVDG